MAKTVNFNWTIQVLPDETNTPFNLSISVDAPQIGSSTVGKPDGTYATGQINNLPLGPGGSLKGKTCFVSTMVTDFSTATNDTVVHYKLNNHQIDFKETVAAQGGSVIYNIQIIFQ